VPLTPTISKKKSKGSGLFFYTFGLRNGGQSGSLDDMARPLRIALPGGWYHVTGRGNAHQRIFRDHHDRQHFLEL
jgi:hypothetical protein